VFENKYNTDEKGVQPGVSQRVKAFADRDQKDVYSLEDGNRELITIIETVCADGTALRPTVIFQGKKGDLQWGENNPCNARCVNFNQIHPRTDPDSIGHSPKGWTDQDLGLQWLIKDFEPQTAARNTSGGYRLLILDGHNSHCSYKFVKYAEEHRIIIICLPAHTTHALQPCDVCVFAPLEAAWKSEVRTANQTYISIDKYNFLTHYHNARERALKKSTILAAFAKTGIHPFNRDAIDKDKFEPAKNTSTEPSQPISTELPSLLVPIPIPTPPPAATASDVTPPPTEIRQQYTIPMPPTPARNASRSDLLNQVTELRMLVKAAAVHLEKDYIQMKLMDGENGRLRKKIFAKENKRKRKVFDTAKARLLTSQETLAELAFREAKKHMAAAFKMASRAFKEQRLLADRNTRLELAQGQRGGVNARERLENEVLGRTRGRGREGHVRGRRGARGARGGQRRGRGHGRGAGHRHSDARTSDSEDSAGFSSSSSEPEQPPLTEAEASDSGNEQSDIPRIDVEHAVLSAVQRCQAPRNESRLARPRRAIRMPLRFLGGASASEIDRVGVEDHIKDGGENVVRADGGIQDAIEPVAEPTLRRSGRRTGRA
jgi:hypothetical protein